MFLTMFEFIINTIRDFILMLDDIVLYKDVSLLEILGGFIFMSIAIYVLNNFIKNTPVNSESDSNMTVYKFYNTTNHKFTTNNYNGKK